MTPFFSNFINKTTVVGITSSAYLYLIYTFMPTHLYNPLVTILPPSGAISSLLLLQSFKKNRKKIEESNKTQNVINEEPNGDIESNKSNEENIINTSIIEEIVDRKIAKIIEEYNNTKQEFNDSLSTIKNVKNDLNDVKNSIKELKSAFETTLVDLKTFQTEMSNPLNFMRKYFDSIDIKSLSDPTLPLQLENNNNKSNSVRELKEEGNEKCRENTLAIMHNIPTTDLYNIPLKNNSLGSMIELISNLSHLIEEFGAYYKQVLSTQCKILRIDKEQEEAIHSIADTLYNSGTSGEAYIESLYNLAKVMGINDNSINLTYHKVRRKKNGKNGKMRR